MDTFDYLGISQREDSYSDLIVNSFKTNTTFRRNLLSNLGLSTKGDWVIESRRKIRVKKQKNSRERSFFPDVLLYNVTENIIAIIENKINAKESENQTKQYCAPYFKRQVAADLGFFNKPEWHFFFLTLDGSEPKSKAFTPITYEKEIIKSIPNSGKGLEFKLLSELAARIRTYNSWPVPLLTNNVYQYLINQSGFVNSDFTFSNCCSLLFRDIGLIKSPRHELRRHHPAITSTMLYKKRWIGKESHRVLPVKGGDECYFIYLDFIWRKNQETACLRFQYDPYPYESQNSINKRIASSKETADFFTQYDKRRNRFVKKAANIMPEDYSISNSCRTIAKYEFSLNNSFKCLKNNLEQIISATSDIIESILNGV